MFYLLPKHIDPLMYRPHGKTTAADNQWWSIYKPTIHHSYSSIQSTSSPTIHLTEHLYIYSCALYWNTMLNSIKCIWSLVIHPSQCILCTCKHGEVQYNQIQPHLSFSAVIRSSCSGFASFLILLNEELCHYHHYMSFYVLFGILFQKEIHQIMVVTYCFMRLFTLSRGHKMY